MFKKILKKVGVVITLLLIVMMAGCGTTVDQIQDEKVDDVEVIAEITQILNKDLIDLRLDPDQPTNYVIVGLWDSVPANSVIEVYRSSFFTNDNLIATNSANEEGSFMIDSIAAANGSIYYVTATEPGKRRSISVRLEV